MDKSSRTLLNCTTHAPCGTRPQFGLQHLESIYIKTVTESDLQISRFSRSLLTGPPSAKGIGSISLWSVYFISVVLMLMVSHKCIASSVHIV
jgi:hypothetical protein